MSSILVSKIGSNYPKVESSIYADGETTKVTISVTLSPNHVDLDNPSYLETKWKKQIPALDKIGVTYNAQTEEQSIHVVMCINGKHNSKSDIDSLTVMASAIATIAEDRLSEPSVISNIGADCKPWFDDEEESCNNA